MPVAQAILEIEKADSEPETQARFREVLGQLPGSTLNSIRILSAESTGPHFFDCPGFGQPYREDDLPAHGVRRSRIRLRLPDSTRPNFSTFVVASFPYRIELTIQKVESSHLR